MAVKPKFLKPADDLFTEDRSDVDQTSGTSFIYNQHLSQSIERQRQRLPVFGSRNHILYLVENFQTLLVVGETGSGKSTQIPQYLKEAGWTGGGIIGVTQPRRVACTALASRVAEECGVTLGLEVGYCIRFDDCTTPSITKIKYLTEGVLVREMMADPLLRQYCVIMLDEVHERTLYTDIVLGLLKKILKKRKDLKLIISSATIDAEHLYNFFNFNEATDKNKDTVSILSVEGRNYPVDIYYLEDPAPDYVKKSVEVVVALHLQEGPDSPGDILVFLTGAEEVDTCISLLKEHVRQLNKNQGSLLVLPMHGGLTNSEQLRVFQFSPPGTRKVIVSTNIAETSITIPGIVYVIDCGFVKLRWYHVDTHTDSLVVVPTSQASSTQRAGRAGRMRSGKVYRLYPEDQFAALPVITPPEMVRTNLASSILNLMALGIDNMLSFDFPSPPPSRHMISALDELFALEAVDESGHLTKIIGQQMAEFPLPPQLTKVVLGSGKFGCSNEILSIASMLQVQTVFSMPHGAARQKARIMHRKFQVAEGDLITLLNVFTAFQKNKESKQWCITNFINYKALRRASEIRSRMLKLVSSFELLMNSDQADFSTICKCIATGLFANAAYLHHSGMYHSVRGDRELHIHPSSVLYDQTQPQWVLFHEVLHTSQVYMRDLTVIDPKWLLELAPHFYESTTLRDL